MRSPTTNKRTRPASNRRESRPRDDETGRSPSDRGGRESGDGRDSLVELVEPGDAGERYRIAVPILDSTGVGEADDGEAVMRLLETAVAITRQHDGEVFLVRVVTVPDQTPLDHYADERDVELERERIEDLLRGVERRHEPVSGVVCVAHREARAVLNMVEKYECDAVLLGIGEQSSQRSRLLRGSTCEKIAARAPCDVFVQNGPGYTNRARRILLAVGTGPHSGLAAETARAIARVSGASVDVIHVLPLDASDDDRSVASGVLAAASQVLDDVESGRTETLEADDVPGEIVERGMAHDVTVLGAPTEGLLEQFVFGSVPETVRRESTATVLMAKQHTGKTSVYYRWIASERDA